MNQLKWFPHDNDQQDDAWIRRLVSENGHVGGWIYWGLCEQLHRHGHGNRLRRRVKDVADYCQTRTDKLRRVLDWMRDNPEVATVPGTDPGTVPGTSPKIIGEWSGNYLDIEIPKLRERLKKLKTKSSSKGIEREDHGTMERRGEEEQKVELLLRSGSNGMVSARRDAALMAQRMPFGKWKGVVIGNLDADYCAWVLNQSRMRTSIRGTLRDALQLRVLLKAGEKCA